MKSSATFTKQVAQGGRGYSIRIPKDVVNLLGIDRDTVLEVVVKVLNGVRQEITNE